MIYYQKIDLIRVLLGINMGIDYLGKTLVIEEKGKKILVIGDLHLGYEESLNRGGVFVGRKMFEEMILQMGEIFAKTGRVDLIVLLGDVKHDFSGVLRQEWNDVLGLIDYLEEGLREGGEIIIARGNHDNYLKNIVNFGNKAKHLSEIPVIGNSEETKRIAYIAFKRGVRVEDYFVFGKYCFLHGDRDFSGAGAAGIKCWVIGHAHPAVKLSDGVKVESYKCFLVGRFRGREVVIVPSFFEYSAGSDARESEYEMGLAWKFNLGRFRVLVAGEGEDLGERDFGILENL